MLPDGTFALDRAKIAEAVTALTRDIMTLQAEGSYTKAKDLLDRLGVVRPQVQKVLDRVDQRAGRHRTDVHLNRSIGSAWSGTAVAIRSRVDSGRGRNVNSALC